MFKKKLITKVVVLTVFFILAISGFLVVQFNQIFDQFDLPEPIFYELKPGYSMSKVANDWHALGFVESPFYLRLYARLTGKASRLKAGEYAIESGMNINELLDSIVIGHVVQHSLTIIEGWTFKQLMQAIADNQVLEHRLSSISDMAIIAKELKIDKDHLEGWFYPDTYHFPRGTTDVAFLRRAYKVMEQRLAEEWQQRSDKTLLKTAYEALILASIIERESAVAKERPLISAVFNSRLRKRMRLQTDPTVIYGMGDDYDGDIKFRDLRRDTPYNTYTRSGLTPTPIAMPSGEAIHAALHPVDSDALYFVATGNGGEHKFSATLEEHEAAVDKYQRRKRRKK